MQYKVDEVCETLQIQKKDLAKICGVNKSSPSGWKSRYEGRIPEKFNKLIEAALDGPKEVQQMLLDESPKKKKFKHGGRRVKKMEVQEIKEPKAKKEEEGNIVALVGKTKDIMKALSEMNIN